MFHSSCRRQISLYDIRNPVAWQEKVFPPPGRVEEKPGKYVPGTAELSLPLVKVGGSFLAMKSVESDAELAASQHAIAILGGAVEAVRDYAIPGTDVRHRLIVVEKVKKTPEKYPRMFAKIKKNPL